ncbi:hypothetical protein N7451_005329 [Penicillium sp. IBT 35674x]|nr:hypothetical protein N7451_005329 [Penicillium sp. IBT 35674x]
MATNNSSFFQHVLASFKSQLEPDLLSQFGMTSIRDLKREVLAIQRKHELGRRQQSMYRLNVFIAAMEQYGTVIEVFLNVSNILAFVWSIYRDIFEFHQQALKYFRKPLLKQIFQETWPNYKIKFGPIIDNLKQHKQLVEGRITFTQLEMVIGNSQKALEELNSQRRSNENIQHRALLDHDLDLLPYIYAKMCYRGEPLLSSEELAKELLETFLRNFVGLYIIVDGLDECNRDEEKKILGFLLSVVKATQTVQEGSIQCAFVSQSDAVTAKILRGLPTIEMTALHNHEDIAAFVFLRGTDIKHKFQLTEGTVLDMNNLVVKKAGGMFLFAKLVMTTLFSQISQQSLLEELHDQGIPDGLGDAYSRVLAVALDPRSRTEALQLLAWLVCAKRQLKWREVQGAVSIDLQNMSVDFQSRQWVLDSKDLCGSLIQLRSDGSLELVHATAKSYLIESGTVNVRQEELKMASLCVGYLSLPAFYGLLGDESVREFLNYGYYAFLDYAACHWLSHVQVGLSSRADEGIVKPLINLLQEFLTIHYRDSGKRIEILDSTRQIFQCLEGYSTVPDFERLLHAFQATKKQVESYGESAEFNEALDMPGIIARIRRVIGNAQSSTNTVEASNIGKLYGSELFKCPRMSCDFFHCGFHTAKQLDDHMMKHKNPFACSFPGCLRNALAFSSQRDLQRHNSDTHKSTNEGDQSFPLKRKKPALQCRGCEEYFYEPKKLLNHACAAATNHLKRTKGSTLSYHLENSSGPSLFIESSDANRDEHIPDQGPGWREIEIEWQHLREVQRQQDILEYDIRKDQNYDSKMTPEQLKEMDREAFPLHITNGNSVRIQVIENAKTWGQLKKWVKANPQASNDLDLPKLMMLQELHFEQLTARQSGASNNRGQEISSQALLGQPDQMRNEQDLNRQLHKPAATTAAPPATQLSVHEQLDSTTSQQRMQVEYDMLKQQQSALRDRIISRAAAEENWRNDLEPEGLRAYMTHASGASSTPTILISPAQKLTMSRILMESLDILGKMDILLLPELVEMQEEGEKLSNLFAMRAQIMRQFKDNTEEWVLNDNFTISLDYLTGAILSIRKMFNVRLFPQNQNREIDSWLEGLA